MQNRPRWGEQMGSARFVVDEDGWEEQSENQLMAPDFRSWLVGLVRSEVEWRKVRRVQPVFSSFTGGE